MRAVNPATGELLSEYPDHGPEEVERRLAIAADAASVWRNLPFSERRLCM